MKQRGPWLAGALLLVLAAVAGGASAYAFWLPCHGFMLSGSVLQGYAYGPEFSDACLKTMDDGFGLSSSYGSTPGVGSVLGLVAGSLVGAAWMVVVIAERWSVMTRIVAALPAAAAWFIVAVAVLDRDTSPGLQLLVWLAPDVLAVAAFVVVSVRESLTTRGHLAVLLMLNAVATFGFVHGATDYLAMTAVFSDANWDSPPGQGYLLVLTPLICGVAVLAMSRHPFRPHPRTFPPIASRTAPSLGGSQPS